MASALHLLLLLSLAGATLSSYVPPFQTPRQVRVMERVRANAEEASAQATSLVTAFMSSQAFRARLTEYAPTLVEVPSEQLLERLRAEVGVTEIAHGFPANNDPSQINALDLDVDIISNATWFYNQWQLPLLYPQRELAAYYDLIAFLAPAAAAEVGLWEMDGFTAPIPFGDIWPGGWPANLSEASDRLVYTILNQDKVDYPCFIWGDVAVVFNNSYLRPMVTLTPMDSGDFTCYCNVSFADTFCAAWTNASSCNEFWYCGWDDASKACVTISAGSPNHDCTVWPGETIGTLDHFDHLFLPFANWYGEATGADRLAFLVARNLLPWSAGLNMTIPHFDYYFEADLAGNPAFPSAVRFMIASLPDLFGTALGLQIRQLCAKWGWPLLWSLGTKGYPIPDPADQPYPTTWPANKRVLDPLSLSTTTVARNISISASSSQAMSQQWAAAVQFRAQQPNPQPSDFRAWWEQLEETLDPNLFLEPLFAQSCASPDSCIGTVRKTGDCVCYQL